MALNEDNINPGGSPASPGPSFYTYKTTDAAADVETNGYFDAMADRWVTGDLLYCVMSDENHLYVVTVTTGDVALQTAAIVLAIA